MPRYLVAQPMLAPPSPILSQTHEHSCHGSLRCTLRIFPPSLHRCNFVHGTDISSRMSHVSGRHTSTGRLRCSTAALALRCSASELGAGDLRRKVCLETLRTSMLPCMTLREHRVPPDVRRAANNERRAVFTSPRDKSMSGFTFSVP